MTGSRIDQGDADQWSTLSDLRTGRAMTGTVGRRAVLVVLLVAVLASGVGLLGVHRRTVTAHGGGYTLTVLYPAVARPGLDVPFRVTVTSDGGFDKDITLAFDRRYLPGIFETQGMFPDNSDATSLGQNLVLLTYSAPPSGDLFVMDYDAYIQPGSQIGASGSISVMHGSSAVVTVHFSTFLFP